MHSFFQKNRSCFLISTLIFGIIILILRKYDKGRSICRPIRQQCDRCGTNES